MITFKCLRQLYSWSINSGLYNLTQKLKVENVSKDLDSCLTYFEGLNENVILILKYIHSYFNTHGMADRNIVRRMRDDDVDNLIKAGIIHLWFVILHPFDDGNGMFDYEYEPTHKELADYIKSDKIVEDLKKHIQCI